MRWNLKSVEHVYDESDHDVLTLARAVAREGRPNDGVAFALVQRFAFLYPHPSYQTLASLVSAYAQPINPRWFPDGDLHLRKLRRLQGNEEAKADEVRRANLRVSYADVPWDDLPAFARSAALEALDGDGNPVPTSVHYCGSFGPSGADGARKAAVKYAERRKLKLVASRAGYGPGVNWFFTVRGASDLRLLEPDEENTPDPKAESDGFPSPPSGVPTGPGWAWRWTYCDPQEREG